MEIKTSDDAVVNIVTLEKMMKPVIDFILEHENRADRGSLFGQCIHILKGSVKITPIEIMGTLFSFAVATDRQASDMAKIHNALGIKPKADPSIQG